MLIPYGKQNIDESDIEAVIKVLKSDTITQGSKVIEFEKQISKYCNSKYSVAANSATSCLHIAMLSLDIKENDIIWTSPISFVASANCALYCNAKIDFVDINPIDYNLDVNKLEEKLIESKKIGTLPKVVIPVHLSGRSCDMERIYKLGKEYDFRIIEDASHAIGSSYLGEKVGSCRYSDICIFSFHPVKIITTAEGGIAQTNDLDLFQKMVLFRSHGIRRTDNLFAQEGGWFYEQIKLGYNYRMNEIQAALGLSQLKRLDIFIKRRLELSKRYFSLLEDLDIQLPHRDSEGSVSSWHLFIIRTSKEGFISRKKLYDKLISSGIKVNVHYIPIYKHKIYKDLGYDQSKFPESEKYYKEALSIPIYFDLTNDQQDYIVERIKEKESFQNIF